MVKIRYLLLLLFISSAIHAQGVLSLDSCVNQAYRNFEFNRQIEFTNQVTEANISGIKKNYLPSLDLNAIATYQNEQISIPVEIPIPGFEAPVAPLNINNALLTLRQWIYDGSITRNQRLIEEKSGTMALQEIQLQQLELKNKVMQLYFSILLYDQQILILSDKQQVLKQRLSEVSAAVASNMLLQSDEDLLKAEMLTLNQSVTELTYGRLTSIRGLEQLTGLSIASETQFMEPGSETLSTASLIMRPDVQLLTSRMDLLDVQKAMVKSSYLPKIGLFADGGLGLPGYDIFRDELAPMAKVGLSMQWHLFDWSKGKIHRQSIDLSQNLLELQRDRLTQQLGVQLSAERTKIEKARQLMRDDEEMLQLYASVSAAFASRLENGTITSADYIQQLNKEQEARSNMELHKLQVLIATLNYNTILEGQ